MLEVRKAAARTVQTGGDILGAAAGNVAAAATVAAIGAKTGGIGLAAGAVLAPVVAEKVRTFTSMITDLATGAMLGGAGNPLNTSMTPPKNSPTEALKEALDKGPLTSEVIFKLIEGLAVKYTRDAHTVACLAAVLAQAGEASPEKVSLLLNSVRLAQGSVDYRETAAK